MSSNQSFASSEEELATHLGGGCFLSYQANIASDNISSLPVISSTKKYYKKEDHNYELLNESDSSNEFIVDERKPSVPDLLSPFKMCWTFGYNRTVPSLNLTRSDRTAIVFSASHAAVIYDYVTKESQFLQGHRNIVNSISVDQTGQWLASADLGSDNAVIVWNTYTCNPVFTLFDVHEDGTQIVGMSPNAYYLVTLSPWVDQKLQLFMWTLGKSQPEATLNIPPEYGPVRSLDFSENCCEHFALTTDTRILFITYENNQLFLHEGRNTLCSKVGHYTGSTYIPNTHLVLSATSIGYVTMWSDLEYHCSFNSFSVSNKKIVIKHVHLQKDAISLISTVDNLIVIVNIKGQITFYDRHLCILYWYTFYEPKPLTSISFHLEPRKEVVTGDEFTRVNVDSNETSKSIALKISSDATLQRKAFTVRDFIIASELGTITYVNHTEKAVKDLFCTTFGQLSSMDIVPKNCYLCCGNLSGYCFLYDFNKKILITQQLLKNGDQPSAVYYIKYSPCGQELACGTEDGTLWLLDPLMLKPKPNRPVICTEAPITKIIFSNDSSYLAHADLNQQISLYKLTVETIILIGIYRAHYKPITDLMFLNSSSLFSIGEDGQLVEYNIEKSCIEEDLVIESSITIEPSAIPLGMLLYPLSKTDENKILIANSEFKYKLFLESNKKCCETTLTHILSSRVSLIEILPSCSNYMVFATDNHIGLQKLPLDGNPYRSLAIVASPSKIVKFCISSDGSYLFTLGMNGQNIIMWNINTKCSDYVEWTGGKDLQPYYSMIEGGREGSLWSEIIDYFCVGQILHQGEYPNITQTLSDEIPICELSDIMRGVGFFPTEQEVNNMYYEVLSKLQNVPNKKNKHSIKFNDFVRLYINHRSVLGLSKEQLEDAFLLFSTEGLSEKSVILKPVFFNLLRKKGEVMKTKEIMRCFNALCEKPLSGRSRGSDGEGLLPFLPYELSFDYFFSTVLGFETNPMSEDNHEDV